jgi:hypothetical protein
MAQRMQQRVTTEMRTCDVVFPRKCSFGTAHLHHVSMHQYDAGWVLNMGTWPKDLPLVLGYPQ